MRFVKSYIKAFSFMILCCFLSWIIYCISQITLADLNTFAFCYGVWVCTLGGFVGPIALLMERKSS